ncbi:hypothetical protein Gferi_21100 [Geosporobacter ferrireducens]|uniref:Uncharacterized protein n=1 Tax=Geosporobacter ferrireducens TaxID=1424294 RepID=A0A1D8GLM9_9FIRM|nr:hypothetical protein Gferi_21100 [Geosporobacter ferrireducens]
MPGQYRTGRTAIELSGTGGAFSTKEIKMNSKWESAGSHRVNEMQKFLEDKNHTMTEFDNILVR